MGKSRGIVNRAASASDILAAEMNAIDQVRVQWLLLRAQDGDRQALNEIVRICQPHFWRHARYLTGRDDAAWDAMQESWIAIVRGLNRIDDPASFRSWAYRIVTRKCADWVRSRSRQRAIDEARPIEPLDRATESNEQVVLESMARLGPDQRAILSLRYLEDMSVRDIAAVLDVPAGTVKSRLHQARNELKEILERSMT